MEGEERFCDCAEDLPHAAGHACVPPGECPACATCPVCRRRICRRGRSGHVHPAVWPKE